MALLVLHFFFFDRTSYDKNPSCLSRRNRQNSYPNAKTYDFWLCLFYHLHIFPVEDSRILPMLMLIVSKMLMLGLTWEGMAMSEASFFFSRDREMIIIHHEFQWRRRPCTFCRWILTTKFLQRMLRSRSSTFFYQHPYIYAPVNILLVHSYWHRI